MEWEAKPIIRICQLQVTRVLKFNVWDTSQAAQGQEHLANSQDFKINVHLYWLAFEFIVSIFN